MSKSLPVLDPAAAGTCCAPEDQVSLLSWQGGQVLCCAPLSQVPLSQRQAGQVAPLLKALADPVRLRLMSLVASHDGGEACVCDLTGAFDLSQPTISHHLKVPADPVSCQSACRAEMRCAAWTYTQPPAQGQPAHCSLKPLIPGQRSEICCTSGVERVPEADFRQPPPVPADVVGALSGIDMGGLNSRTLFGAEATPEACQAACRADGQCLAWTYVRPGIYLSGRDAERDRQGGRVEDRLLYLARMLDGVLKARRCDSRHREMPHPSTVARRRSRSPRRFRIIVREASWYASNRAGRTMRCGQSPTAVRLGMAERTPKVRAS